MDEQQPFEFAYSLDERDYARCVLERNFVKNLAIPFVLGILVSAWSIMDRGYYAFLIWLYVGASLSVLVVGGGLALLVDRIAVRREFRSNRLLNSGGFRYSLRADGIEQVSEASTSFIARDKIHKLRETRGFALVYISRRMALMFPKRVLGAAGLAALRALNPKKARR